MATTTRRVSLVHDLVRQHVTGTLPALKRFDDVAGMAATLTEAENIQESFSRKLDEIASDSRFTVTGKEEARVTAGRKALAALEKWHGPLRTNLEAHEQQLRDELRAVVSPKPPSGDVATRMEGFMVRSELRRAVAGKDREQIEVLYRTSKNPLIRKALEEIPDIVTTKDGALIEKPFITDEVREEVLLDAGRRALPETSERIEDINEVRGVYSSIAVALRREVEEAAPGSVERAVPRIVA